MGMLFRRRGWGNPAPTKEKEKQKEVSTNDEKRKNRKTGSADLPGHGK